ncbi:MAG: hypothetical protein AAGA87_08890 [Pseudomonadota bacterium]
MSRLLLTALVCTVASGATAATLEIPWTLTKTIPSNTLPVQGVDGDFILGKGGINRSNFKALLGFELDATMDTDAVELRLPGVFRIEAPDTVLPGSSVDVRTSFELRPTASDPITFRTIGVGSVDTKLTYDLDFPGVDTTGEIDLPDNFSYEGVGIQSGNTDTFETTFSSIVAPDQSLTRSYFTEDFFGNQLPPRATSFTGYELTATDNVDGVKIEVDLYDAAASLPTPAAPFLLPGTPVIDLDLGVGADLEVSNTLSTNMATMYFTGDNGATAQTIQASRPGGLSQIRIPETLTPGSTYDLNFFALGLGYNIFSEIGLIGNVDLELAAEVFGVGFDTELFSKNFTDSEKFGRSLTYYYESILTNDEFAGGQPNLDLDISATTLTFQIAGQTCDQVVTLPNGSQQCDFTPKEPDSPPVVESAELPFSDILPDASAPGSTAGAGGMVQTGVSFTTPIATDLTVIPVPASLPLLAGGLGLLVLLRSRRASV